MSAENADYVCSNCCRGLHCCCQGDMTPSTWCLCKDALCNGSVPFVPYCGEHK